MSNNEYQALRRSAGVFRHDAEFLHLAGDDRFRFLNGQVTCDVANLKPGDTTYGFFTTAKGRIEADVKVVAEAQGLLLQVPVGSGEDLLGRLRKYIIVDRVEPSAVNRCALSLIGPDAAEVKAKTAISGQALVEERPDGFNLWLPAAEQDEVLASLVAAGAETIGAEAWERYRIEAGRPVFGRDFGLDCFPQETGLEEAVSYTKGCYLGQEVVARIHYRGGVQRLLRGLRVESDADIQDLLQAELHPTADGAENTKAVGRLTSVARCGHQILGWSIVHNKATAGSTVALLSADGDNLGRARLVELPFDLDAE